MFRRKDEENEFGEAESQQNSDDKTSNTNNISTSQSGSSSGSASSRSVTPPPLSAKPASPYRPASPASSPSRPSSFPGNNASRNDDKGSSKRRVLTVGNDILLKGEIATCDRLVIEGAVDAKLNDVHTVEIAEAGSFLGSAEIEDAEISGLFEGELVVRNRLVIYSTGKVRGKITYGEIEIERGGELMGEITSVASETEFSGRGKTSSPPPKSSKERSKAEEAEAA